MTHKTGFEKPDVGFPDYEPVPEPEKRIIPATVPPEVWPEPGKKKDEKKYEPDPPKTD